MAKSEEQLRIENEALKEQAKKLFKQGLKSEVRDSLIAEGSNSDLLVPHIMEQIKIIETDGAYSFEIINKETNVGRVNNQGKPLSIKELILEMKENPSFVMMFDDTAANAKAGKPNKVHISDITRDRTKPEVDLADIATGKTKVDFMPTKNEAPANAIPASDMRRMGQNLEDIEKGNVQVDMTK